MLLLNLLSLQFLVAASLIEGQNCSLAAPPENAGETQAHGVILYIYPRSHNIGRRYSGCQNQWFFDDDHFRKLSVVHFAEGTAVAYDNINLHGDIGYHCRYETETLVKNSDNRCPRHGSLRKKTYQAGCYSLSKINSSDSYEVYSKNCQLK